mmetsp:Transcript_57664/g.122679  ORF Transcript_57664/g.122679 Transcript_57664/m.122679 type:complete len:93 (-) Transcript_57664:1845-2123(-)
MLSGQIPILAAAASSPLVAVLLLRLEKMSPNGFCKKLDLHSALDRIVCLRAAVVLSWNTAADCSLSSVHPAMVECCKIMEQWVCFAERMAKD